MNVLGIDFEDWFHPEFIQKYLSNEQHKPKVIDGIDKIIDLLRKHDTKATFFVVGELLEFKPELLDIILENDHEIAFHTMKHTRIDSKNFRDTFEKEIKKFNTLTNGNSKGFRAPSFSLNESSSWVIDTLNENNYIYDSSVVPAKTKLYGIPKANTRPYMISSKFLEDSSDDAKIIEFPLMVTKFLGKTIPAGGGFYLRTLPLRTIKNSIKTYQNNNSPAIFYIHSWELTPELMPKVKMSKQDEFVTYHNLKKAYPKMEQLLKEFKFTSFEDFMSKFKIN